MKIIKLYLLIFFLLLSGLSAKDYTKKSEVRNFINKMSKYKGFSKHELQKLFKNVKFQKKALAIYVPSLRPKVKPRKNYKRQGSWDRYENIFIKPSKAQKGVEYMHKHKEIFSKVYHQYKVEPEIVAAIIGIESHYGKNTGKYPVFDTLTTLAFEKNRRNRFYRSELKEFLLMTKRQDVNPKRVKGSVAGAIGLGQFIPSNYKTFVVDYNKDGKKRMNDYNDAIASVAYYLKSHGWKRGKPIATRVKYSGNRFNTYKTGYRHKYHRSNLKGIYPYNSFDYKGKVNLVKLKRLKYDELWYGTKNWYVITRYNHSDYYAMAVYQLSQLIKKGYKKKYGHTLR